MSLSIDPYSVLRDFVSNRKEKRELESLLNKEYKIQTNGSSLLGLLVQFNHIDKRLVLLMKVDGKQLTIPFDSVQSIEEVGPQMRLRDLLEISRIRGQSRPTYLLWLLNGAKPIREAASRWFDDEMSQVSKQVEFLVTLFPHRGYDTLKTEAETIKETFYDSVAELDRVLNRVEKREATRISDIYHSKSLSAGRRADEEPDILLSFVGIFGAAENLDKLIKRVDGIVANIEDTVTVMKIVQSNNDLSS
ncbi:MAG: hypothetical protein ACYCPP_03640 [Nitrososphaerales archaeon]